MKHVGHSVFKDIIYVNLHYMTQYTNMNFIEFFNHQYSAFFPRLVYLSKNTQNTALV